MSAPDAAAIVDALLATARLPLSDDERAKLTQDYPKLRAQADALYAFDISLDPAVKFDPLDFYPSASAS